MNKEISTSFYCTVETLSPVHVGSGVKYINNVDFFYDHSTIHIIDTRRLFSEIEKVCSEGEIPSLIDAIEDRELLTWLTKRGIEFRNFTRTSYRLPNFASREILEHLRDGRGKPIVPGSTLKGAFRTAVLRSLVEGEHYDVLRKIKELLRQKRDLKEKDLKRIDSIIAKDLLGKDPNHDLLRTLSVGDFAFSREDLILNEVSIKSLQRDGGIRDKHFKIFPELLKIGSCSTGVIGFDNFLPSQDDANAGSVFGFKTKITPEFLRTATLGLNRRIAEDEKRFFSYRNKSMASFYQKLLDEMESLEENELILRISWGSGWKSITGELLPSQDLDVEIRSKLKLAPHRLGFEFPKSRKVVWTESGDYPLGWVKISLEDMESIRAKRLEESKRREKKREESERLRAEEAKKKREQEEKKKYLESLTPEERAIARVRDPEITEQEVVEIYNRLDEFPEEKKKELALALRQYWEKHGKWSGKLSEKQKQKVRKVKQILGET